MRRQPNPVRSRSCRGWYPAGSLAAWQFRVAREYRNEMTSTVRHRAPAAGPPPSYGELLTSLGKASLGGFLGFDADGEPQFARIGRGIVVSGAPESGKTLGVFAPTAMLHRGPAVVASRNALLRQATVSRRRDMTGSDGFIAHLDPAARGGMRGFD